MNEIIERITEITMGRSCNEIEGREIDTKNCKMEGQERSKGRPPLRGIADVKKIAVVNWHQKAGEH